ncbi:hypothetical protein DESC_480169 [Desulfosarcina cetonica]|nr:hypothetical protein DESC_480169 [Desulfosarcina cetonica]
MGLLAHGSGRADQFHEGFALGGQGSHHGRHLGIRGAAFEDFGHHLRHLVFTQIGAANDGRQVLLEHDRFSLSSSIVDCGNHLQKIAQQPLAHRGHDRFGMELDTFGGVRAMPQPHDFAVIGRGGDLEAVGQARRFHRQAVVAHGLERRLDPLENPLPVGGNHGGLAMHQPLGRNDLTTKGMGDGLMPQTDPQDGNRSGKTSDHIQADPGGFGPARARRNHDGLGGHGRDIFHVNGVVALDHHAFTDLPEVLHQVVGERIIVVDHQYHFVFASPCRISSKAR